MNLEPIRALLELAEKATPGPGWMLGGTLGGLLLVAGGVTILSSDY